MMDADYIDDLVLLSNTPAQAESLLQSLEQVARGMGFYVKVDKTDFMGFELEETISTLSG